MDQPARRPRRLFSKILLLLIVFVAVAGGYWFGLIPHLLLVVTALVMPLMEALA